jgi:nitroreductase
MLQKPAVTTAKLHPVLKSRWSPRAFANEPIDDSLIISMLEAARWAPSASNEQPWSFILGKKGDETYQKIFDTLVEFNQLWAVEAPVLIMACGRIMSTKNPGKPNATYQYDLGQAVAHLTFQAAADGLIVHQMAGFDATKAAEFFFLPDEIKAITVIAVGTFGDPEKLHPNLKKLEFNPRERRPLAESLFAGKYGESAPIALESF